MKRVKNQCFTLAHLNARSLWTGQDELCAAMTKYGIDVLAVNESWIVRGSDTRALDLPGYCLAHRDRATGRGGGVAFYIRRGIRFREIDLPSTSLEQLWICLEWARVSVVIGTAYRPPTMPLDLALDCLGEAVTNLGCAADYMFLTGDLNIDLLKRADPSALNVMQFLNIFEFEQLVAEPTRIAKSSETLIDLLCCSPRDIKSQIIIQHNPDLSDHALLVGSFNVQKPRVKPHKYYSRSLDKINFELFESDLANTRWEYAENGEDINKIVGDFNSDILKIFDVHAPVRERVARPQAKPWVTDTILLMMRLRDRAHTKAIKSKKASHIDYYKTLKNLVISAMRREKRAYFAFFVNKNQRDSKKLWQGLQNVCAAGKKNNNELPHHLCDPDKINDHFVTLPCPDSGDTDLIELYNSNRFAEAVMSFQTVSEETVLRVVRSLKSEAVGVDGISARMLKLTLPYTISTFTKIINLSLTSSTYPEIWKKALVTPIGKTSTVQSLNHLRPISILPAMSKVIEKVVHEQLRCFLESINSLPRTQSGFRRSHSTSTALLSITNDILSASDKGEATAVVLLDYSRAFDCLSLPILMAKLHYYGVSYTACEWFRSYFHQRCQMVKFFANTSHQISKLNFLSRGVPQGSILGPLLFTLYTSDIASELKHMRTHFYADDTQLYLSFHPGNVEEVRCKINEDLSSIWTWSHKHALLLNPAKSCVLIAGTKSQIARSGDLRLLINGQIIPMVQNARNLGLTIDSHLRFIQHVSAKVNICFMRLKCLYKFRPYLSIPVRKILVESLILPLLDYGDIIYGPRLLGKSDRLIQRIQNACARFCFVIPRRFHVTPYLNSHGMLRMHNRRRYHTLCFLYRLFSTRVPSYLYEQFTWSGDSHGHNTRARERLLIIPEHRSAGYRGTFKFASTKLWNDLPPPLKNMATLYAFKKSLRQWLLQEQCRLVACN